MTTTIIYSATSDGYVSAFGSTYAQARAGTGTFFTSDGGATAWYGQQYNGAEYAVTQAFAKWVYTAPAGEAVTSAALRFYHAAVDLPGTDRDLEARQYDYGTTVDAADYRNSTVLPGLPLLATIAETNRALNLYGRAGSTALLNLLKAGSSTISVVISSSRSRLGTTPTNAEQSQIASADEAGTTSDPALVFTSTARSTLFGVLAGSVRLADGSWAVLESDGAAAPVITLRRHTGTAVTTIATIPAASFADPVGAQGIALAVDASDNLYVIGGAKSASNSLVARAYVKGSGFTWTAASVVTLAMPSYAGPINAVAAAWQASGGAGRILCAVGHSPGVGLRGGTTGDRGSDLAGAVLNASTVLAGSSSGHTTISVLGGAFLLPFETQRSGYFSNFAHEHGSGLEVVAGSLGVGYVAGHGRSGLPSLTMPVGVGRYAINSSGVVSGGVSASASYGTRDAGAKVRLVPCSGDTVAVVTADSVTGYGVTIRPYQVNASGWTALSTATELDSESLSSMPAPSVLAVSSAWDAVYVPNQDKVWIYYPDATDPRIVKRTGYSLSTYAATREQTTVATVGSAGGTNVAVRVSRNRNASGNALLTVAHKSSGGTLSTSYVADPFSLPPTEPVLTPRANYDAALAATYAWAFVDPNVADTQSAYQLQIINASTLVSVLDTGKVTSATPSRSVAGGTLTNGVGYQWRVMTWDAADQASPWSPYSSFTTGAAGSVTITDPATDNPPGVVTNDYLTTWSVSGTVPTAYKVDRVRVSDGVTGTSGWITSTATSYLVTGLVSDVEYEIRVTVRNASAVESAAGTRRITSSYSTPDIPVVTLDSVMDGGYMLVSVENPPPTGDRPTPTSNEVYRRASSESAWTLVGTAPINGQWRDYTVSAGVAHDYMVRAVA